MEHAQHSHEVKPLATYDAFPTVALRTVLPCMPSPRCAKVREAVHRAVGQFHRTGVAHPRRFIAVRGIIGLPFRTIVW